MNTNTMEEYTGNVVTREVTWDGTTRSIAVLLTSEDELILARTNTGTLPDSMVELIGKSITCTGTQDGAILIVSKWVENDAD